jgi:predicted DNA-binding antitoxin AbrB/MazE fold protein
MGGGLSNMITVEAIYEGGVLKPMQPLPLQEHGTVQLTVQTLGKPPLAGNDEAERVVRQSQGILGWTGDVESLRRLAQSPEFDPQEGA